MELIIEFSIASVIRGRYYIVSAVVIFLMELQEQTWSASLFKISQWEFLLIVKSSLDAKTAVTRYFKNTLQRLFMNVSSVQANCLHDLILGKIIIRQIVRISKCILLEIELATVAVIINRWIIVNPVVQQNSLS